jgi:hypothetical protein
VYDSKEFTGNSKSRAEKAAESFYKISQKTGNHLRSLGVLHRRNDVEGRSDVVKVRTPHILE